MEVSIWKQCRKSAWFGNTIKAGSVMEIVWWKRGRNTELVRDKYSLYWLPRLIFPYGLNISTTSYNKSTPKSFLPLLAIFLLVSILAKLTQYNVYIDPTTRFCTWCHLVVKFKNADGAGRWPRVAKKSSSQWLWINNFSMNHSILS